LTIPHAIILIFLYPTTADSRSKSINNHNKLQKNQTHTFTIYQMATSLLKPSSTCYNLPSNKIHLHHHQLQRTYSSSPLSKPICSLESSQETDAISTNHNTPADGLQTCFIGNS